MLVKKVFFGRYFSWVVVFLITFSSLMLSFRVRKNKSDVYVSLSKRFQELSVERDRFIDENEELKSQIQSQDDPLWVELTIMKVLGLVPEGQKKVYFRDE